MHPKDTTSRADTIAEAKRLLDMIEISISTLQAEAMGGCDPAAQLVLGSELACLSARVREIARACEAVDVVAEPRLAVRFCG